jgi:hypothetical protein
MLGGKVFERNFPCKSKKGSAREGNFQNVVPMLYHSKKNPCKSLIYKDLDFVLVVPTGIEPISKV